MKKIFLLALFTAPVLAYTQPSTVRDDPQSLFTCDAGSLRTLLEINIGNTADAYPWLSADGLRLYFTQETSGYQISFTERANTSSPFSALVALTLPVELASSFSCWLTADELHMYLSDGDNLFHLSRNNVNANFDTYTQVTLTGLNYAFISAPSLDPDGLKLYAYVEVSNGYEIGIFEKTATDDFSFEGFLLVPFGMKPEPGQLSKNGLRYYLGLQSETTGESAGLFTASRESLLDPFDPANFTEIEGVQSLDEYKGQCTVSGDEQTLVFTYSPQNSWPSNDLYLIECDGNFVSTQAPSSADWAVYPNPSAGTFSVKSAASEETFVDVYNAIGLKVWSQQLVGEVTDIQLVGQPNGIYVVQLRNDKKAIGIKKIQLLSAN